MLIRDALTRIDRRLLLCVEADPAAPPGGGTPPVTPPGTAPPITLNAPATPPAADPKAPDMLAQFRDLMTGLMQPLTARLEAMEGRLAAPPATPPAKPDPKVETPATPPTPPADDPAKAAAEAKAAADKMLADAQKAAADARALALTARVEAHLQLEKPEYARLAPAAELDASGNLTAESIQKLDGWKAANPRLVKSTAGLAAHTPGPGGPGHGEFSPEDRAAFAIHKIDPTKTAQVLTGGAMSGVARFLGYEAKPPHSQGGVS